MPAPATSPPKPAGSSAGAFDKLPRAGIEKGSPPPTFGIAVPAIGKPGKVGCVMPGGAFIKAGGLAMVRFGLSDPIMDSNPGSGIPAALASSSLGKVRSPGLPAPGSCNPPGRARPPPPGPVLPSPGANPLAPVLAPGNRFMPRPGAVPGGGSPGRVPGDGSPGNFGKAGSAGSLGAEFTSFCRASAGDGAASPGCGSVRAHLGITVWSARNRIPARFRSDSASVTPPFRL
mmetsp:Transcript_24550/g.47748  ORF Transcript_24550/g.47748 Transcript_24550/m.47748 type:complete len:231 (+) Transcript_24550:358-1050(+)